METIVQLRAAKIPFIGKIAVHYWYAVLQGHQSTRWEVWQTPHLCKESWGHLHKNLMPFESGVGNGESWLATQWEGEMAEKLAEIIDNTPETYPYKYLYRYFPGPNSNTYVQWILNQANCNYCLSIKGIGKGYKKFLFI